MLCRECGHDGTLLGKTYGSICRACWNRQMCLINARARARRRSGERLPFGQPCALCFKPMASPCLDHCHSTGEVRAYLCRGCNGRLGHCRDDPVECERRQWRLGAQYLLRHAPLLLITRDE